MRYCLPWTLIAALALAMNTTPSLEAQEVVPETEVVYAAPAYGGVYFTGDVIFARPYATENAFQFGTNDFDTEAGYRLTLGYQTPDGLGIRARWFDYEQVAAFDSGLIVFSGLDVSAFDIELTTALELAYHTRVVVAGGFRFMDYEEFAFSPTNTVDFEGSGPTLGIELQRDLVGRLGAFASYHTAFLFGDDNGNNVFPESLLVWSEMQLGLQLNLNLAGTEGFIRGGVEAHVIDGLTAQNTQKTGLYAYFFGAGINY